MECEYSDMDLLGHTKIVWSEEKNSDAIDVNTSAVRGTVTTDRGDGQLEEVMCSMDIPPMATKAFRKY